MDLLSIYDVTTCKFPKLISEIYDTNELVTVT